MLNKKQPYMTNPLFLYSHMALFGLLLAWFSPFTHTICEQIDIWVFQVLNGSLVAHSDWQTTIGILNHRREARLNLLFAALFNLWAILSTQDKALRMHRLKLTLYFWICFQIGFSIQDFIINHLMHIKRNSPSLVLTPFVKLSEVLQDPNIKDASKYSFLGGHAFAMIYWASFSCFCAPKRIAILGMFVAILLCLPRLFSGAHWFSDVLFAAILALVWLSWTLKWGQTWTNRQIFSTEK